MGWRCGNYKKMFSSVAKDVMKNRELRELYFQKYGVKYKVRKEKRRNS